MKFIEFTVHTTTEGSELVADLLWNYTSYGVAVRDAADIIALQRDKSTYWDYMDEDVEKSVSAAMTKLDAIIAAKEKDLMSI